MCPLRAALLQTFVSDWWLESSLRNMRIHCKEAKKLDIPRPFFQNISDGPRLCTDGGSSVLPSNVATPIAMMLSLCEIWLIACWSQYIKKNRKEYDWARTHGQELHGIFGPYGAISNRETRLERSVYRKYCSRAVENSDIDEMQHVVRTVVHVELQTIRPLGMRSRDVIW
jgi:hypothetical protein